MGRAASIMIIILNKIGFFKVSFDLFRMPSSLSVQRITPQVKTNASHQRNVYIYMYIYIFGRIQKPQFWNLF